ncbi:P-loop NTPase [filamentous cyanobacterium LEGE 11480]|uniref:P-loop NTPase n=1 Tax=Romeriopsis navalis LEGE 11480 TaxID=2777977 RepID=A0A928Z2K0_9CYAN|nr:polysaccharide biosynthesis tyrosine autokinase [Romeriopsis navalis]MBE9029132.1 P-loop NTPase [Romeriopsis navalis LEGE 11480]
MAPPILKRYLLAIGRYKWVIPTGLVLGVGASGMVVSKPDPPTQYTIQATLVGNAPPTVFSATGVEVRQPITSYTPDSLLNDEILQETAKAAGLDTKKLAKSIEITLTAGSEGPPKKGEPAGAPSRIQLDYKDTDQGRAKQVIELIVTRIIEQSEKNNKARLQLIIDSLNLRLPKVKRDLAAAERALESYDRTEGPALFAAQNGSLVGQIQQSDNQKRQMQLELQGIAAELASLQQRLGLSPTQAYVSSALSADPIVADLRAQIYQLESQRAIAAKNLRAEHPTMIDLKQRLEALDTQLRKRANEVLSGGGFAKPFRAANIRQDSNLDPERQRMALRIVELTTTKERLERQYQSLVQLEQESRQRLTQIPNKQLARTRLEDQLQLKKALHDQMQAKLVDAKTAEAETVSSLSIGAVNQLPVLPTPPKNIPLMMAIGGLVGLILGGGIVFLLDTMEGTFYTEEDLREALKQQEVPLLGVLPMVQLWDPRLGSILTALDSPYLEYYERFRSTLRRVEGGVPRMVLVTSTASSEGKSVTAYNLAIAAARAGKRTLLIEADLRSPSIGYYVGVEADVNSQEDALRYYGQLSECIRIAPLAENLYIAPSVGPQRQSSAILESNEMRRLLEDARGRFDFVVVDTPSLSRCNDALLLEPYTDGLILVTRPGITQSSMLNEAINEFMDSEQTRLLGAVINGVDMQIPQSSPEQMPGIEDMPFPKPEEVSITTHN